MDSLRAFRGESKFSTWLYRIAANYLSTVKRRNWVASEALCSFAAASAGLRQVPDADLPDPRTVPVPVEVLVEETKISCLMGTLLCLDRVYSRRDLRRQRSGRRGNHQRYGYLRGNCSLADPANTSKCARKTRAFIQGGFVDPQQLRFSTVYTRRVRAAADVRDAQWSDTYAEFAPSLYRDHPFYEPSEQAAMARRMLASISLEPTN